MKKSIAVTLLVMGSAVATSIILSRDMEQSDRLVTLELATSEGCQALVSSISSFTDLKIKSARACLLHNEPRMQTTQGIATLSQAAASLLQITPGDKELSQRFLAAIGRGKELETPTSVRLLRSAGITHQWSQLLDRVEGQILEVSTPGLRRGPRAAPVPVKQKPIA